MMQRFRYWYPVLYLALMPASKTMWYCDKSQVYAVTLMNRRLNMTAIWPYFTINDGNKSKAVCKLCSVQITRGGTTAFSYNVSNMNKLNKHLYIREIVCSHVWESLQFCKHWALIHFCLKPIMLHLVQFQQSWVIFLMIVVTDAALDA